MKKYDDREKYPDAVVFRVAQLFIGEQLSTVQVAEGVNTELRPEHRLTRESIYPLLAEAIRRRFVRLIPPANENLARQLAAKYPNVVPEWTRVVDTAGRRDNDKVAAVAAQFAVELLAEIKVGVTGRPIGLGLGPGRATLDFCQHFSQLIQANPEVADLSLIGISAGGPPYSPEYSPTSFFNLFPPHMFGRPSHSPKVCSRKVGLFAETLIRARDLKEIKTRIGVREAVEARKRDEIDLVVTAMGDNNDEHDLLATSLEQSGVSREQLKKAGWVGNVQYRPYSAKGPIEEKPDEYRVVTVFELKDLVELSQRQSKHVLLIARQCGICGRTRAESLRPLLTRPEMKVFSRLVVDAATVVELLKDP